MGAQRFPWQSGMGVSVSRIAMRGSGKGTGEQLALKWLRLGLDLRPPVAERLEGNALRLAKVQDCRNAVACGRLHA